MADEPTGTPPPEGTPPPTTPQKPADVPDKFWRPATGTVDYKAWADAHRKLETDLLNHPKPKPDGGLQINPTDPNADRSVDQILSSAGLDPAALAAQYMEHGKLTPEQYAALKQQNFARSIVDTYLQGQHAIAQSRKAQVEQSTQRAADMVGGADALENLRQWAGTALAPADMPAMNTRLADPAQIEGAIRELRDRHTEAIRAGKAQPLINTGAMPPPTGPAPKTREEVQAMFTEARAYQDRGEALPDALKARILASGQTMDQIYGVVPK